MSKQEFNGKTLDEALSAAARALGTDVTLLSYNILPQSSGGLLSKLFSRGVRLEAWIDTNNDVEAAARAAVKQAMADVQEQPIARAKQSRQQTSREDQRRGAPQRDEAVQNPRMANATKPTPKDQTARGHQHAGKRQRPLEKGHEGRGHERASESSKDTTLEDRPLRPRVALSAPESQDLLKELAREFVKGFDQGDSASQAQIDFQNSEDVSVTVDSPVLEDLLSKSDRLSCAFEHLFKRIAQKKFGDVSGRVVLNAGAAANLREEKLKNMALDIASKVKSNGKSITLASKSSQERRVIHLALENMEGIATKSIGVGENRKLIIYSTQKPHRNAQQPRRHQGKTGGGQIRHPSSHERDAPLQNHQETDQDGETSSQGKILQNQGQRSKNQRHRGRRGFSERAQHQNSNRTPPSSTDALQGYSDPNAQSDGQTTESLEK